MPVDPFGNFSTLFGIGQHITLSPETMNDDLTASLALSVLLRHHEKTTPWVVTSILSSLLQTALNVAISNVQSRLPVFGVWGTYSPEQVQAHFDFTRMQQHSIFLELFPKWICLIAKLPQRRRRLFSKSTTAHLSRHYIPPFVSATILPGLEMDSPSATFWVSLLPGRNLAADSRLSVWGNMLLRHCPPSTTSVVLCGARHVYTWLKSATARTSALVGNDCIQEWRTNRATDDIMDEPAETVDMYRRQCRRHAEKLLQVASGATATDPRWGPLDDPIASVNVTVCWNGRTNDANIVEPLISLPFRIRSRRKMSRRDWMDMEDSVERTLLDPYNPSSFVVQTHYDKDTSVTPLAASQRCILAAMIRSATLPHEILMQYLTSEAVMDDWSSQVGEQAAKEIVNHANLDQRTRQLVEAMDWTSIADDMIESWEAEQMVRDVFECNTVSGFPSPPEESFCSMDDNRGPFEPLGKSAPPGRLLSMLFLSMSRLHAPSSMALVWMKFVNELRSHWDMRESLPNMGYVPGLDPSPEELNVKNDLSTIGLKADYAAFVNSSEPDPDDGHCLIGQKLQVSACDYLSRAIKLTSRHLTRVFHRYSILALKALSHWKHSRRKRWRDSTWINWNMTSFQSWNRRNSKVPHQVSHPLLS
jgi:Rab3 GTPase-activating protein catalytic subunit